MLLWRNCCTGFWSLFGGLHGLPFSDSSTDCTADPLMPEPVSVHNSCADTCSRVPLSALVIAPPRLTAAVPPFSVTSPILVVPLGKAVLVAPLRVDAGASQSPGGFLRSSTSPSIRLAAVACN